MFILMQRIKRSVLSLRERKIEYLFEDKEKHSLRTSIMLLGSGILELAYHIYPFLIPGICYADEIRKPETENRVRENVYYSLLRKGYPQEKVRAFIDSVNI